jgi:hypothetical protein
MLIEGEDAGDGEGCVELVEGLQILHR